MLTFVEIYFPVPAPHHSRVDVVRYPAEPFGDFLGVVAVHLLAGVPPVLLPFEKVRFAVFVSESRVDIP